MNPTLQVRRLLRFAVAIVVTALALPAENSATDFAAP